MADTHGTGAASSQEELQLGSFPEEAEKRADGQMCPGEKGTK